MQTATTSSPHHDVDRGQCTSHPAALPFVSSWGRNGRHIKGRRLGRTGYWVSVPSRGDPLLHLRVVEQAIPREKVSLRRMSTDEAGDAPSQLTRTAARLPLHGTGIDLPHPISVAK